MKKIILAAFLSISSLSFEVQAAKRFEDFPPQTLDLFQNRIVRAQLLTQQAGSEIIDNEQRLGLNSLLQEELDDLGEDLLAAYNLNGNIATLMNAVVFNNRLSCARYMLSGVTASVGEQSFVRDVMQSHRNPRQKAHAFYTRIATLLLQSASSTFGDEQRAILSRGMGPVVEGLLTVVGEHLSDDVRRFLITFPVSCCTQTTVQNALEQFHQISPQEKYTATFFHGSPEKMDEYGNLLRCAR